MRQLTCGGNPRPASWAIALLYATYSVGRLPRACATIFSVLVLPVPAPAWITRFDPDRAAETIAACSRVGFNFAIARTIRTLSGHARDRRNNYGTIFGDQQQCALLPLISDFSDG